MLSQSPADPPPLALDDIMHTMSPSPAPQPLPPERTEISPPRSPAIAPVSKASTVHSASAPPPRPPSPEPLDHTELETMRTRAHQYTLTLDPARQPEQKRELDLAEMVVRLTSHLLLQPTPAQLATQAEIIADLTFQRNLLLQRRQEDTLVLEAERACWERTAQALHSKAHMPSDPGGKDVQESKNYIAQLEDDNKAFRRRISETVARMVTLENELEKLKPFLLMQPVPAREAEPSSQTDPIQPPNEPRDVMAKKGKRARVTVEEPAVPGPSQSQTHNYDPLRPLGAPSQPRPAKAKSEKHSSKRKSRQRVAAATPLLTDARAECVLVAARRVGRARAGFISGLVRERKNSTAATVDETVIDNQPDAAGAEAEPPQPSAAKGKGREVDTGELEEPAQRRAGLRTRHSISQDDNDKAASTETHPEAGENISASPQRRSAARIPKPPASPVRQPGSPAAQRRIAPSPFAAPLAPPSPIPAYLTQTYPQSQTRPGQPHTVTHPHLAPNLPPGSIIYYAPPGQTNAQGAPIPMMMPLPAGMWPVPTTSATPTPATHPAPRSPAKKGPGRGRGRAAVAVTENPDGGPSTAMDSLVSAARTLIEDEDYDGSGHRAEAGADNDDHLAGEPEIDTDVAVEEEAEVEEEEAPPPRRRGARRKTSPVVHEPPPAKRRRTANGAAAAVAPPPSPAKTRRRGRAAPATQTPATSPAKAKPRARNARAKGKYKAQEPETEAEQPAPITPPAPSPPVVVRHPAQPVVRVRSALDVLAEQAAQEQERRPSVDAERRTTSAEPPPVDTPPSSDHVRMDSVPEVVEPEPDVIASKSESRQPTPIVVDDEAHQPPSIIEDQVPHPTSIVAVDEAQPIAIVEDNATETPSSVVPQITAQPSEDAGMADVVEATAPPEDAGMADVVETVTELATTGGGPSTEQILGVTSEPEQMVAPQSPSPSPAAPGSLASPALDVEGTVDATIDLQSQVTAPALIVEDLPSTELVIQREGPRTPPATRMPPAITKSLATSPSPVPKVEADAADLRPPSPVGPADEPVADRPQLSRTPDRAPRSPPPAVDDIVVPATGELEIEEPAITAPPPPALEATAPPVSTGLPTFEDDDEFGDEDAEGSIVDPDEYAISPM